MIEFIVLFLFIFVLSYNVTRVFRMTRRDNNKLMDNIKKYEEREKNKKTKNDGRIQTNS